MNQEKAREFFSSYYEGVLDDGLRQALEGALKRDGELRRDYREFEGTYEELRKLKFEVIDVPSDLHERVMRHLGRHAADSKPTSPRVTLWLRNVAVAGVAAAAIVGAVIALKPSRADVSSAGIMPVESRREVSVSMAGGTPVVEFAPSSARTVEITQGVNGKLLQRVLLDGGDSLRSPLRNLSEQPIVFAITVKPEGSLTLVTVPGTKTASNAPSDGTLEEFSAAMASRYAKPIVMRVSSPAAAVSWDLESLDPVLGAASALDERVYRIEMRDQAGPIWITER